MKSIIILLLTLGTYSAYSQTWNKVDIDDKLSISIPGQFDRAETDSTMTIKSSTPSYTLTIGRITLPKIVASNSDSPSLIEYFAKGVLAGMGFSGSVNTLYDIDGEIGNVNTKTLHLKFNDKPERFYY